MTGQVEAGRHVGTWFPFCRAEPFVKNIEPTRDACEDAQKVWNGKALAPIPRFRCFCTRKSRVMTALVFGEEFDFAPWRCLPGGYKNWTYLIQQAIPNIWFCTRCPFVDFGLSSDDLKGKCNVSFDAWLFNLASVDGLNFCSAFHRFRTLTFLGWWSDQEVSGPGSSQACC